MSKVGVELGPETPEGVYARRVGGRVLMVNGTTKAQTVRLPGTWRDTRISGITHGQVVLEPYGAEVFEPAQ